MEIRKIQVIGGTYVVSLPKKWAKGHSLKRGSKVTIEIGREGAIVIYPFEKKETKKEIDITYPVPSPKELYNEMTAAYLLGFNTIRIRSNARISYEDREVIKDVVRRFMGLEITEEDSKSITVQFLLEVETVEPKKAFKRMHMLTKGMFKDAITSILERDPRLSKIVIERDDEVDRLYFLLVRLLRSVSLDPSLAVKLGLTPIDCLDYRVAASLLETVGDDAVEIAKVGIEGLSVKDKLILKEISRQLEAMQDKAVDALLLRSRKEVDKIVELYDKVGDAIERSEKINGGFRLHELMKDIARCSIDLVDLVIPFIRV